MVVGILICSESLWLCYSPGGDANPTSSPQQLVKTLQHLAQPLPGKVDKNQLVIAVRQNGELNMPLDEVIPRIEVTALEMSGRRRLSNRVPPLRRCCQILIMKLRARKGC